MSENPNSLPGGLPQNFNLSENIAKDTANIGEFEMPKAVEAARRQFEIRSTDKKTGLQTQESWMDNLSRELQALEPNDKVRVYVADLDGFKSVNDSLSHTTGDELLDIVGQAFRSSFTRKSDVLARGSREEGDNIARLGGDEFAVYSITKTDINDNAENRSVNEDPFEQSRRINERLRSLLTGTKFEKFNVSLSVGNAEYEPGDTAEKLLVRADYDMLRIKYQGKIDSLSQQDKFRLQEIVPYMESIGARVEDWVKAAIKTN